ncbi:MAG TPA: ATP-binding cassette domain-containing protein [Candidatus Mediterraneibacter cottocaccae]|nr:ATP-binding cassette domain-containing protein [Candidatus Mediterraneibacter cottocaccae]
MLELQNITKYYGARQALDHVSLTLENGIYGLLGPNGAGKSTLMNIITGNLKPTSGTVLWNGENAREMGAAYRSLLGYAPQQQGLYDTFTGIRFLSYMAALKGIPKKEQRGEIRRVLDYVNLTEKACRPIGTWSGGMKQRILVAQAILGDPHLVVLDEPTAGLDPKERVRIRENIRSISGDKIILVSTHVVSDIESIAKEIILLREGKIVGHDTVSGLCKKHGDVKNLEQVCLQVFGEEEENDGTHTV